ncbi:MAG: hypothetical protein KC996_06670 [Phycisphaerales bacterium]|nr:hypothetical protein [Phycisphaerales bacterium]
MFAILPNHDRPKPDPEIKPGILAGMRIRKKLFVLHTTFSLSLGIILLLALKPAMSKVMDGAEQDQAEQLIRTLFDAQPSPGQEAFDRIVQDPDQRVRIRTGAADALGISAVVESLARGTEGGTVVIGSDGTSAGAVRWLGGDEFLLVRVYATRARKMIRLVYALVIVTLLAGYALVAGALEMFVLPGHVYRPIGAILKADHAVQDGDREHEIIPMSEIPADELGEIMRSRNESIISLRNHEQRLAQTLDRLEHAAADLHKKNMLLETAKKNLEGADRLASLGMMSAGIAHELNTPLAVVKGLVDKLAGGDELSATETMLLSRVVGRLEKLSDGLLDFARVRPPTLVHADIRQIVEDAWTLLRLDRQIVSPGQRLEVLNEVPEGTIVDCDPDRLVQVFVNLLRNAIGALRGGSTPGVVRITAEHEHRDEIDWVKVCVEDNGPGIDADLIGRLFEPFVSTKLDAKGTGLGLAVANGIIHEHDGILTATNRSPSSAQSGAVFEVLLRKPDTI